MWPGAPARTPVRGGRGPARREARWQSCRLEQYLPANPVDHIIQSVAEFEIGEDDRLAVADGCRIAGHDPEIRADVRRKIDLVDDEEIAARDAGAPFARYF